jgi:hypothetical protein
MALCKVDFVIGQCGYRLKFVNREAARLQMLLSSSQPLTFSCALSPRDFPHNSHAAVCLRVIQRTAVSILIRSEVFTAVTMKNVVFWDMKPQFVLHRRHITSPLQSPAS